MDPGKCRFVTRSDFDGLVCAMLLKELDMIGDIKFVHPKDMQDGTILISENDITANLPYIKKAYLAFDHHFSETVRLKGTPENFIIDPDARSTARVVYDHFGGRERFPNISEELLEAVDKCDAGLFTFEDIVDPRGWVLLNFIMDARTGLGRFKEFRVSNYQLMMELIDYCRENTVDELLTLPDVEERVDLYNAHQDLFKDQIRRCFILHGNLGELDLRGEDVIYAGNRFMIYALYPEINISMHVIWGLNKLNTVFALGKSILNRTSGTDIARLMLEHGGGGHRNAGTCQIDNDDAERVRTMLIERISTDG